MKNNINLVSYDNLEFHRNGICGESFYSIVLSVKNGKETSKMLATFQTDKTDRLIDRQTCRVIDLANPTEKWRGDEYSYAIQKMFSDLNEGFKLDYTIYDFCEANRKERTLNEK